MDMPEKPFEHATREDVEGMVQKKQLLCLYRDDDGDGTTTTTKTPIGCIKCEPVENKDSVGEWGCLALAAELQIL